MIDKSFSRGLIELNLAMIFLCTSGVLGRFIDVPVAVTIGSRSILAGIILYLFCKWQKFNLYIHPEDRSVIFVGGFLLGAHWITYFYALKLSNVAIGMLSLFTYPAITAILEPVLLKTKIQKFHIFLSITVLIGIYFLVPDFSLENDILKGVALGILSAFGYSFRNVILKTKVRKYQGSVLMVYQLLIVAILLIPAFFIFDTSNVVQYLPATILLAVLTTAIGHTLFLYSLKYFSTATASIISCIQPVYGIITGMIFLNEFPKLSTVFGGSIIILSVLAESIRMYRLSNVKTAA